MSEKLTRQGVRDLSHIKGKPKGRKLQEPPVVIACKHRKTHPIENGYFEVCDECGETFEIKW